MNAIAFLLPFVLLGAVVVFVAFSGGPGAAREAYMTRGNRGFKVAFPLIYIVLGLIVPGLILAARDEKAGGTGALASESLSKEEDRGKVLFKQQCSSCHSLAAVNARGVTGPNLDEIGNVTAKRIENAIRVGGTGQGRMPERLLEGKEATEVAKYVAKVAGK